MAHRFRIQTEPRLATFLFDSRMTVAEGADLFLDYVRTPGFDPTAPMLCDARRVVEVEASFLSMFTRVTRLAPEISRFREPVDSVVLVGNQTIFGYVRMLQQILDMTSVIKMHPVWTEDEALDIVGLAGARLDELLPQP